MARDVSEPSNDGGLANLAVGGICRESGCRKSDSNANSDPAPDSDTDSDSDSDSAREGVCEVGWEAVREELVSVVRCRLTRKVPRSDSS